MKKNPFSEIIDFGYIISDEYVTEFSQLAEIYSKDNSQIWDEAKKLFSDYNILAKTRTLMIYISYALDDNMINNEEYNNIKNFMDALGVSSEGLREHNKNEIDRILLQQLYLLLLDDVIDDMERKEIFFMQDI